MVFNQQLKMSALPKTRSVILRGHKTIIITFNIKVKCSQSYNTSSFYKDYKFNNRFVYDTSWLNKKNN